MHIFFKPVLLNQSNQYTMNTIKHPCVPQTLTPEALADWIQTQKVDTRNHVEEIPLTEEEIVELEHTSSLASRSIDKLNGVKKYFDELLKKGTSYDRVTESYKPATVTIPPTKGLDALKANREHADKQIELGHKEEITALYMIPYPEHSKMIMVNIVGVEWPEYSRDMTGDEINQYKPLLRASKADTLATNATVVSDGDVVEDFAEKSVAEQHDVIAGDKKEKKKTRSQRIEEKKSEDEKLFPDDEKIVVAPITEEAYDGELKSDIGGDVPAPGTDPTGLPFD